MRRAIFLIALACSGCSTVTQTPVAVHEAGFVDAPIRVDGGYIISEGYRAKYNALIKIYGHKLLENGAPVFTPPLDEDAMLSPAGPGHWFMPNAARENKVVMESLQRRGAAP